MEISATRLDHELPYHRHHHQAGLLTVPGIGPRKADCLLSRLRDAGYPEMLHAPHRLDRCAVVGSQPGAIELQPPPRGVATGLRGGGALRAALLRRDTSGLVALGRTPSALSRRHSPPNVLAEQSGRSRRRTDARVGSVPRNAAVAPPIARQ